MFDDDSVELIYACHVIEYFDRIEVLDVLHEWRQVLKSGGFLRLAVQISKPCARFVSDMGIYRSSMAHFTVVG